MEKTETVESVNKQMVYDLMVTGQISIEKYVKLFQMIPGYTDKLESDAIEYLKEAINEKKELLSE